MSGVEPQKLTPIQEFYTNSNIFLTGATGFFGKIILDKLLRFSPGINTVYILIRPKKSKTAEERIEQLFSDKVFDLLKVELPDFRRKIVTIVGDCLQPNLGVSQHDVDTIARNVNIVFHAAATVKFDEHIKTALRINVQGTRSLIDICKKCINLKCFMYVSTAYTQCCNFNIEEKFYDTIIKPDKLLEFVEGQNDQVLDKLTPSILGSYPNTYSFTKAVAEEMVRQNCEGLPITMFRPAIVVGTYREPIPGWIDNMYGPTGVVLGVGAGLLRVMCADKNILADIVPVDMVVNSMLSAAWDITNEKTINDLPPVTNYVSSKRNPITWGQFFFWNMTFGQTFPLVHTIWYYTLKMTPSKHWYYFLSVFQHFLPGLLIDLFRIAVGKKPKMIRAYRKINRFLEVISFFSTRQWDFQNDRVQSIWERMDARDRKLLPFRMEDLKWDEFFFNNIKTMRWSLMNDSVDTIEQARKRLIRLKILHYTLKYLMLAMLVYALYSRVFVGYFDWKFTFNCS